MQIGGWLGCGLRLSYFGLGFHGLLEDGVEPLVIQGETFGLAGAARGLHWLGQEGFGDFEFHCSNCSRGWDFILRSFSISTCSAFLAFSTRSCALAIASALR